MDNGERGLIFIQTKLYNGFKLVEFKFVGRYIELSGSVIFMDLIIVHTITVRIAVLLTEYIYGLNEMVSTKNKIESYFKHILEW